MSGAFDSLEHVVDGVAHRLQVDEVFVFDAEADRALAELLLEDRRVWPWIVDDVNQAMATVKPHEIVVAGFEDAAKPPVPYEQWNTAELVDKYFGIVEPTEAPEVTLNDFDPDGENKLLAAICYSSSHLPESQLLERVRGLSHTQKVELITAYVGERGNRRHKPGRAFERLSYRFDVLGDYGAFRDLQRHRLLTVEWQRLTPHHGYARPELVDEAGGGEVFDQAMQRSDRKSHV